MMTIEELKAKIDKISKLKTEALKNLEFEQAASLRDYEKQFNEKLEKLENDENIEGKKLFD